MWNSEKLHWPKPVYRSERAVCYGEYTRQAFLGVLRVFVWMQTAYLLRLNLYKHIHKFQSFLLISKFIHLHTCLAVLGTGPKALHTLCKYTTM